MFKPSEVLKELANSRYKRLNLDEIFNAKTYRQLMKVSQAMFSYPPGSPERDGMHIAYCYRLRQLNAECGRSDVADFSIGSSERSQKDDVARWGTSAWQ